MEFRQSGRDHFDNLGRSLPCPFCGETTGEVKLGRYKGRAYHCSICGADGPIGIDNKDAFKQWNTRRKLGIRQVSYVIFDRIDKPLARENPNES